MCIQSKVRVARKREAVYSQGIQQLGRLQLARRRPRRSNLSKAIGDEENEHDEQSIRRPFDFEVAEERIRAKEVQRLVDDIHLVGIRLRRRPSDLGLYGENSDIAHEADIGLLVERRMVCRHGKGITLACKRRMPSCQ